MIAPFDLTGYPEWQRLVEQKPAYRKAWREGKFPPPAIQTQIRAARRRDPKPRELGVGDYLERLIFRLTGEVPDKRCPCKSRIREMNRWGVDGCKKRLNQISKWVLDEAHKRRWIIRLPGVSWLARRSPGGLQRWSCRMLVRLAIRQAERRGNS